MGETVYDSQIVGILAKMGDKGMSVQMLAKHLYNMNCSLFEDRDIARHAPLRAAVRAAQLEVAFVFA